MTHTRTLTGVFYISENKRTDGLKKGNKSKDFFAALSKYVYFQISLEAEHPPSPKQALLYCIIITID